MTTPRITIITPNLNQAAYLERAICSVLDQGYESLEYLVIDGGSTDGSLDIIQRYADEITWWQSEPDEGPADAINRALTHATGEVIGILNSDDLYLPGTLTTVARRMTQDDQPAWAVGQCLRIGGRDEELGHIGAAAPGSLPGFLMHDSGFLPAAATFYRKSVFDTRGGFDASLRYAHEYEFACRLLASGTRPVILPQMVAAQRELAGTRTVAQTLRQGLEYVEAAERFADLLPLSQRYALWRNCDERRRIYALAEAEASADEAQRLLWQRLLRRPWWLASERYRQMLLHGAARGAIEPREAA